VTSLPDWLVERAALDEVAPSNRARLDGADSQELADRIATVRADNAAELSAHPAGPAVAQIEERVAAEAKRVATRRRRRIALFGAMASAAAVAVVVVVFARPADPEAPPAAIDDNDGIRVKGAARLLAFRQSGDRVENLDEDAVVRAGDVLQLRYNGGGRSHGLIASVDGAGAVTLHFPATEDAPTTLAARTTTLPHAYALDDAPRFERFFFLTSDAPIDIKRTMTTLGSFARRTDCATASPEFPTGIRQWSLRLRKPDRH
jgi:hypothetical protein